MAFAELESDTLVKLGQRIAEREISSVEITRHLLDRISRLNPYLHAFATIAAEEALRDAAAADEDLLSHGRRGPVHGVPIALKDLISTSEQPTACGMPLLAGQRTGFDATIVTRLKAAGAVIIGKAEMTEGAGICHHPEISVPVNPWDASRSSGFSSSGCGVAVAAGLCAAAIGSDTGGSIRIPAVMNGVTGLKPSWGRISRSGLFPVTQGYDTAGPMTRSAADAAALLGIMAGPDPADPTALPERVPDYLAQIGKGIGRLVIGFDQATISDCCDAETAAMLEQVASVFVSLGARLRPVSLPAFDMVPILPLMSAGMMPAHRDLFPAHRDRYGPALCAMLDQALATSGIEVAEAINCVDRLCGQLALLFADVDLLLLPVLTRVTPQVGAAERDFAERPERLFDLVRFTGPVNVSRNPAIALPGGIDSNGMPMGFQLVARHFEEVLLLRAGYAWQQLTDWHRAWPNLRQEPSVVPGRTA
ncbi:amidase [Sphingobium faniae]|nr:amidase [Sphingobium faniae]